LSKNACYLTVVNIQVRVVIVEFVIGHGLIVLAGTNTIT
jgi:hypothetical protein